MGPIRTPFDRGASLVLVGAFFAALAIPPIKWLLDLRGGAAAHASEARAGVALPRLGTSWEELVAFPGAFDAHYADQFGLRGQLLYLYSLARVRALGVSTTPGVILGREGWLFYGDEGEAEQFRATRPLDADELRALVGVLEVRRDWLEARGIRYLFAIAPNKSTIYPEYMPAALNRLGPSQLDQLVVYCRRSSTLELLDLRPTLEAARRSERVYDRTDSHWNERGAFAAYQALVSTLSRYFRSVKPAARASLSEVREQWPVGGDLARMLGLREWYEEEALLLRPKTPRRARTLDASNIDWDRTQPDWMWPVVTEIDDATLPRALVLRDSFAERLIPFLSEHFRRALYLFTDDFDGHVVDREKPDLVIELMIERHLSRPAPNNLGLVRAITRDAPRR